jgi:hypothetical protein
LGNFAVNLGVLSGHRSCIRFLLRLLAYVK